MLSTHTALTLPCYQLIPCRPHHATNPYRAGPGMLHHCASRYRAADFWLNGVYLGHHESGYAPFRLYIHNLTGAPLAYVPHWLPCPRSYPAPVATAPAPCLRCWCLITMPLPLRIHFATIQVTEH